MRWGGVELSWDGDGAGPGLGGAEWAGRAGVKWGRVSRRGTKCPRVLYDSINQICGEASSAFVVTHIKLGDRVG